MFLFIDIRRWRALSKYSEHVLRWPLAQILPLTQMVDYQQFRKCHSAISHADIYCLSS